MPRYATTFRTISLRSSSADLKLSFPAQQRWHRSLFEFVIDEDSSIPLGLTGDPMSGGPPHVAHYLFNSMPCAYAWFHH
jgi:hypothetical protein